MIEVHSLGVRASAGNGYCKVLRIVVSNACQIVLRFRCPAKTKSFHVVALGLRATMAALLLPSGDIKTPRVSFP